MPGDSLPHPHALTPSAPGPHSMMAHAAADAHAIAPPPGPTHPPGMAAQAPPSGHATAPDSSNGGSSFASAAPGGPRCGPAAPSANTSAPASQYQHGFLPAPGGGGSAVTLPHNAPAPAGGGSAVTSPHNSPAGAPTPMPCHARTDAGLAVVSRGGSLAGEHVLPSPLCLPQRSTDVGGSQVCSCLLFTLLTSPSLTPVDATSHRSTALARCHRARYTHLGGLSEVGTQHSSLGTT